MFLILMKSNMSIFSFELALVHFPTLGHEKNFPLYLSGRMAIYLSHLDQHRNFSSQPYEIVVEKIRVMMMMILIVVVFIVC